MLAINALPTNFTVTNASSAFSSFTQTSGGLVGINSTDGINQTYVVDIDAQQISSDIVITGDPGDVYIFRWDDDHNASNTNFANGYGGQVKFNQAALLPGGGMTAANFVHVAGDVNSSGGSGGGFYGYWLTTGSPTTCSWQRAVPRWYLKPEQFQPGGRVLYPHYRDLVRIGFGRHL